MRWSSWNAIKAFLLCVVFLEKANCGWSLVRSSLEGNDQHFIVWRNWIPILEQGVIKFNYWLIQFCFIGFTKVWRERVLFLHDQMIKNSVDLLLNVLTVAVWCAAELGCVVSAWNSSEYISIHSSESLPGQAQFKYNTDNVGLYLHP